MHPILAFDIRGNKVSHGRCGCCQYMVLWWNRDAAEISKPYVSDDFKSAHRTKLKDNQHLNQIFFLLTLLFIYLVMPLASSLLFSRLPGIGWLLNSRTFVFKLQSIGTWLVGLPSSLSAQSSSFASKWLLWLIKFENGWNSFESDSIWEFDDGFSLALANKRNTESSET